MSSSKYRRPSFCRILASLTIAIVCLSSHVAYADDDFHENEFEARPAPPWVRMVDLGEQDSALAGIEAPAGIKVEIVAQEPTVINPVDISFDEGGRPHVLEWRHADEQRHMTYTVKFQDGAEGTVNRMWKSTPDELKSLHDTNGDGEFDEARLVMNDLEMTSTAVFYNDAVYLPSVGHVLRRRQSQPAGPFDQTEEIIRGLCGFHHHQVSGVTPSHDDWLFITSGDDDNLAEGSDGSRATVLRTGAVFRARPDGSHVAEFARGFRNPYRNVTFDHLYNMFHVDNDQEDGSKFQGVRLMHVLEGADYGWRLAQGAVCCQTDFQRGAAFGEQPGKMPSMLKTGRGAPAGLLIYQGKRFPDFFRGLLIYPDVYRKLVRAYRVERAGSTFRVTEQFTLMKSEDPLFRPCHAVMGPDGAIYIADWRTDSGGAGKLWGDGLHGRIYRLSWGGLPGAPAIPLGPADAWAKIAEQNDDSLWANLDSADYEIRNRSLRELCKRGEAHRERFVAFALDTSHTLPGRATAIGGACRYWDLTVRDALLELLADNQFEVRRLAADAFSRNLPPDQLDSAIVAKLIDATSDEHPAVQRAAALALGRVASLSHDRLLTNQAAKALYQALLTADRNDPYLFDGFIRGLERLELPGIELVVSGVFSTSAEEQDRAIFALESMRTRPAATALDGLFQRDVSTLSADQLVRLIGAYRHILVEPPIKTDILADWLGGHPDADTAVQLAVLETIGLTGATRPEQLVEVAERLLHHADAEVRTTSAQAIGNAGLNSCSKSLAAALSEVKRSETERREIVQSLGKLRSRAMPFTGVMSPPGVETVLKQVAAAAADPRQGAVRADLLVLLASVDFDKARPIAREMLAANEPPLVTAAINALGANAEEAAAVGKAYTAGKLDQSQLPAVAEVLRRHAANDQIGTFRQLLQEVFKGGLVISTDPEEVARVERLVAETGDVARGRDLYFDKARTQCATCHSLEGTGGKVGPDLTRIWDTHTVAKTLQSILEPSSEIKEGYAAWTLITADGLVYTGLKISETDEEIVLRDNTGKDIRVPQSDVEELTQSEQSLMPDGLVVQLSYQELVDLVAFLKNRQAQEALRAEGK